MKSITTKIAVFNAAYKIALDYAIERKLPEPDLARKLSDAVRVQMKFSQDPAVIAEAAVTSLHDSSPTAG
jgi:hypothetical protein